MLLESLVLVILLYMINFCSLSRFLKGEINFKKIFLTPSRVVAAIIGIVLWAILYFSTIPLYLFILIIIVARMGFILPAEILSLGFKLEWTSEEPRKYKLVPKSTRESKKPLILATLLIISISAASVIWIGIDRPVANAVAFNQTIKIIENEPFLKNEIPAGMMRLVTPELARSIAEQHLSSFGSNMEVKGVHISIINNTLVWVVAVGSTNTFAENYIQGIVVVKASDPLAEPILIKKQFNIGEGLFLFNEIHLHSYERNPVDCYGTAYITQTPDGDWVYIVTRYYVGPDLIERADGIIIYNPDGTIKEEYSMDEIPEWVPQLYDEAWLEGKISQWGSFRRGDTFDFWARGFLWIQPSRDLVEISEDLRYIQSPDTGRMIGIVTVHPAASDRTLAGVFVINTSGIFYYDYRKFNYISGRSAIDYVEGRLVQPAQGFYYGTMPLLYAIKVNNETRVAWFVPIYWAQYSEEEERITFIRFAGLGIVDALDPSYIVVNTNIQGKNGPQVVNETITLFKSLFGVAPKVEKKTVDIIANVTNVYQYIYNGMTHIVLELDNSTYQYIEGTPDKLTPNEWYELLATKIGDRIHAKIEQTDDGKWIIVEFDNLEI